MLLLIASPPGIRAEAVADEASPRPVKLESSLTGFPLPVFESLAVAPAKEQRSTCDSQDHTMGRPIVNPMSL
jgi:hypothetical protein